MNKIWKWIKGRFGNSGMTNLEKTVSKTVTCIILMFLILMFILVPSFSALTNWWVEWLLSL